MNHRNDAYLNPDYAKYDLDDEDWLILTSFRYRSHGLTSHEIEHLTNIRYSMLIGRLANLREKGLLKNLVKCSKTGKLYRQKPKWVKLPNARPEVLFVPTNEGEKYGRAWPRPSVGAKASAVKSNNSRPRKGSGQGQFEWSS